MAESDAATNDQRAYATSRGVSFPPDITHAEMNDLLQRRRNRDSVATDSLRRWAVRLGVDHTRHVGQSDLLGRIRLRLGKDDQGRAEFYVWRVVKGMTAGVWDDPHETDIDPAWVASVAAKIVASPTLTKSMLTAAAVAQREGLYSPRPATVYTMVADEVRVAGPLPRVVRHP